jgi:hypothetical protein
MSAGPIFVHSLFRSGSTYLFEVFRRSPDGYWCYQEPLNEHLRHARDRYGVVRRTSLAISGALSSTAIAQATRILAEELGWSPDQSTRQEASFRQRLADDHGLTSTILTARDRNTGSLECA